MKPQNKKTFIASCALAATFLALTLEARAQSNGSSGGGTGVRQEGALRLQDMVDPSVCINNWTNGEQILATNAELRAHLARLKAVNWYFALALEREIRNLDFCVTNAELKRPRIDTTHSVLIYDAPDNEVIGVRIFGAKEVYMQRGRYNQLGPSEQGLFYIHEAMHSFIPLDASDRYTKLFSVVRAIGNLTGQPGIESRSFATVIRKAEVALPQSSDLISDEKFLAYLFDTYDGRKNRILDGEITLNEILRPRTYNYLNLLPPSDAATIAYARDNLIDEAFREFCMMNDDDVIAKLRTQTYRDFSIDLYCVTAPGMIDRILDHPEILDTDAVKHTIGYFYTGLARATAWVQRNRVVVSKELDWISGNPAPKPKYRYALEIKPAFQVNDQDDAQINLVQVTRILVAAAKTKSVGPWMDFVRQSGAFMNAFNFARLERVLDQIQSPIPDEAKASKDNLRSIYKAAVDGIVIRLRNQDLDDHADALVAWINQAGLGFQAREE